MRNATIADKVRLSGKATWIVLVCLLAEVALAASALMATLSPALGGEVTPAGETIDVPFEKYWDDKGYEDRRPDSVTVHLHDERNPDVIVRSIQLTEGDAVPNEDDHWHGTFENVPKRDASGNEITYIVTEDVPEGYIASYDYGYDGYDLTFTDDSAIPTLSYALNFDLSVRGQILNSGGDFVGTSRAYVNGNWVEYSTCDYLVGDAPEVQQADVLGWHQRYYPLGGRVMHITTESHGEVSYNGSRDLSRVAQWQGLLYDPSSRWFQKYPIECIGDTYPETPRNYPHEYANVWSYRINLGRNVPVLRMLVHSESWGSSGPELPIGVAFDSIVPTRSSNKPLEITNTINLTDYPIRKVWDDKGRESHRPQSVTVDIYQDDATEPIQTITLSDRDGANGAEWDGAFVDLPKYRSDYTKYDYTIKERPVSGYDTTYDSEYYNALDFTFSEGTNINFRNALSSNGGNGNAGGAYYKAWDVALNTTYSVYHEDAPTEEYLWAKMHGMTVTFPGTEFYGELNTSAANPRYVGVPTHGITAVKRVHIDGPSSVDRYRADSTYTNMYLQIKNNLSRATVIEYEIGKDYEVPATTEYSRPAIWMHYKWDDHQTFAGADIIVNHSQWQEVTFTKIWDDANDSSDRPESSTFDLVNQEGEVVKTVTLTKDDAFVLGSVPQENVWKGTFGDCRIADDEGNPLPYRIVERPVAGYKTLYESSDEHAAVTEVTFRLDALKEASFISDGYVCTDKSMPSYFSISDAANYSQNSVLPVITTDGLTFTVREMGSRMLVYASDQLNDATLVSVRHLAGNQTMIRAMSQAANPSMPVELKSLNTSSYYYNGYNKVCLTPDEKHWSRPEGNTKPVYLLYEQTEPFDYCNIIRNVPLPQPHFLKKDEDGNMLAGAEFRIIRKDDEAVIDSQETLADSDPIACARLDAGEYLLREAMAPNGYSLANDVEIRVDAFGGIYTVDSEGVLTLRTNKIPIVVQDKKTLVKLIKEYEGADEPNGTSHIQILDDKGNIVAETDDNETEFEGVLTSGRTYTLHETSAPQGYSIATDMLFAVNRDATKDTPQSVTLTNKKTMAEISKIDGLTKQPLAGASMILKNSDGEEVDRWVSTSSPYVTEKGILVTGERYTVHEEQAPDGHLLATDMTFTAGQSGSPDRIEMEDQPTQVIVEYRTRPDGSGTPGGRIAIVDDHGTILDEWTATDQPHAIIGKLNPGATYTLHESNSPTGYKPLPDMSITVSDDGSIDRVAMVDETAQEHPDDDGMMPSSTPSDAPSQDVAPSKEPVPDATPQVQAPSNQTSSEGANSHTQKPSSQAIADDTARRKTQPSTNLIQTGDPTAIIGCSVVVLGIGSLIAFGRHGTRNFDS